MTAKTVLLVEGKDDEHVVKHICAHHHLGPIDKIVDLGGIDRLLESFPVQLEASGVESLGVLVDADADLQARWQSICNLLVKKAYQAVPAAPCAGGTIITPPENTVLPRVGIWLMPDNRTNGILEDFLRFLVPPPNPLFDHAVNSIDSISKEERRFSDSARPKALIHTWLAWQEEPGKPMGTAITARYLDAGVPEANDFVSWLKQLFFT